MISLRGLGQRQVHHRRQMPAPHVMSRKRTIQVSVYCPKDCARCMISTAFGAHMPGMTAHVITCSAVSFALHLSVVLSISALQEGSRIHVLSLLPAAGRCQPRKPPACTRRWRRRQVGTCSPATPASQFAAGTAGPGRYSVGAATTPWPGTVTWSSNTCFRPRAPLGTDISPDITSCQLHTSVYRLVSTLPLHDHHVMHLVVGVPLRQVRAP